MRHLGTRWSIGSRMAVYLALTPPTPPWLSSLGKPTPSGDPVYYSPSPFTYTDPLTNLNPATTRPPAVQSVKHCQTLPYPPLQPHPMAGTIYADHTSALLSLVPSDHTPKITEGLGHEVGIVRICFLQGLSFHIDIFEAENNLLHT